MYRNNPDMVRPMLTFSLEDDFFHIFSNPLDPLRFLMVVSFSGSFTVVPYSAFPTIFMFPNFKQVPTTCVHFSKSHSSNFPPSSPTQIFNFILSYALSAVFR